MERKAIYGLVGACCLIVGVIAFLAVPRPGSAGTQLPRVPGVLGTTTLGGFHCGVFDRLGVCAGNFWLRVAIFVLFAVVGLFFIAASYGRLEPVSSRATTPRVGFDGTRMPAAAASTGPLMTSPSGTKACPDCAEQVKVAARKCRFCGYVFETNPA